MSRKTPYPGIARVPVTGMVTPALRAALDACAAADARPRAVQIAILLAEALAARGGWPPADLPDDAAPGTLTGALRTGAANGQP